MEALHDEVAAGMLAEEDSGYCPVRPGEIVDGRASVEWNGLRIGLCCGECAPRFRESPALFLDDAGIDWKAAVALEVAAGEAKTQEDREHALDKLRARGWKVVREPPPLPKAGLLVDLANDLCPTDFEDPDGITFAEWNGLRVRFCCAPCISHFWGRPGLVLEHAGIEWKEAAAAVKRVNEAGTAAERDRALKELRAKWKVVREVSPPSGKGE